MIKKLVNIKNHFVAVKKPAIRANNGLKLGYCNNIKLISIFSAQSVMPE